MAKKYGLRTVNFWVRFDPENGCLCGRAFRTKKGAEKGKPPYQVALQVKGHYVRHRGVGNSFGYSV